MSQSSMEEIQQLRLDHWETGPVPKEVHLPFSYMVVLGYYLGSMDSKKRELRPLREGDIIFGMKVFSTDERRPFVK